MGSPPEPHTSPSPRGTKNYLYITGKLLYTLEQSTIPPYTMKKTLTALMALASLSHGAEIDLSIPASTDTNVGIFFVDSDEPWLQLADYDTGSYMYTYGDGEEWDIVPNKETGEGILIVDAQTGENYFSLAPRRGVGGSGEAIILDLDGVLPQDEYLTYLTFSIEDSYSNDISGAAQLGISLLHKHEDSWSLVQHTTGTLNIGEGSSLNVPLYTYAPISDNSYKIIATVSNTGALYGSNAGLYTVSGIGVTVGTDTFTSTNTPSLVIPYSPYNSGMAETTAMEALTAFATQPDGAYMFNAGGLVNTNSSTGEGFIRINEDGKYTLTLAPRHKAGGSGEAIVLSALGLERVGAFQLNIKDSWSEIVSGEVALTLAVIYEHDNTWEVLQSATGSLLIGEGATLTLNLDQIIEDWTHSDTNYKVVAVIDDTAKALECGENYSALYTMEDISITAHQNRIIPEPATATLSLLALVAMASRRRRK